MKGRERKKGMDRKREREREGDEIVEMQEIKNENNS